MLPIRETPSFRDYLKDDGPLDASATKSFWILISGLNFFPFQFNEKKYPRQGKILDYYNSIGYRMLPLRPIPFIRRRRA